MSARRRLRVGADRLLDDPAPLRGRHYGVLSHQAALLADGRLVHLALADTANPPRRLFAPEHGFYGVEQDMVAALETRDPLTEIPVVSLYGENEASLRPRPEAFDELDLLIVDLQDVGSRYYTFVATAIWAAEVALELGKEVWILDRPNPLGGAIVEGNIPCDGFESFVGAFQTPVRHGLTLAELARLELARSGHDLEGLSVYELDGWSRRSMWPDSGRTWMAPSPNMPDFDTAAVYPGGCLLEATTLSEGRGTTRPFRLVGAPWIDPRALLAELERPVLEDSLRGLRFVPVYFRPQFQKHAGEVCGGVEVLVEEPSEVRGTRFGLEMLRALFRAEPEAFGWRAEPYEFRVDRPALDLLLGTEEPRRALEAGDDRALVTWVESWKADQTLFREDSGSYLLY